VPTVHDDVPTRAELRRILVAAADCVFSDGVPDAFLDQWTDETLFLLETRAASQPSAGAGSRRR